MNNSSFRRIHRTESYLAFCLLHLFRHFDGKVFKTRGVSFSSGIYIDGYLIIFFDMPVHGKGCHRLNGVYDLAALSYQSGKFRTVKFRPYALFLRLGDFEFIFHDTHFFHKPVQKVFNKLNGVYFVLVYDLYDSRLCSEPQKAAFGVFKHFNGKIFSRKSEFFGSRFYCVVNGLSGKISFHKRLFLLYLFFCSFFACSAASLSASACSRCIFSI